MISFLMWNRFIPCKSALAANTDHYTHLVLSGVLVVSTVIIHQIDKLEVVSLTTLEIVRIVRWRDLDSTSTE